MITLQQIQDAHKKILPYVNYTPLINSNFLSKNTTVKLKLENFQITDLENLHFFFSNFEI